ncbi:phosphoribosylglycinamide formyltransferase 2 [Mycobacterium alsense]|uniref:Formate-dependent phosphoribosylglycinamide formyltransferase n=1 Tax=Mycobacterium alsense TaxID=324058 RepID=A0AA41XNG3_9MYCO|nr:formate-dependent phosphoribosylglycinamide formyltransferase [Mycobacterium alsense]OQZ90915.1 phosphoribosylglycinamide formyltransferase 2 [Mycobacterium alsense]
MTDGVTEGPEDETTALVVSEPPEQDADDGRPKVLLLGGGELGRELEFALRHLGAKVIAVDDGPALADELSATAQRLTPQFVVTATDALGEKAVTALEALATDRTELVPNARTVRLTTDREALRRLAADELGLPTAPFWFVGSVGELRAVAAHAGYPLLVKPVSGRGHSVVSSADDIEPAWQRALGASSGRVMAETVVEVDFDVTLLAVRSEDPEGPVIEFCSPIGHRDADGAVLESWQPQQMTPAAVDAAKSVAARIVKALGGRGVFAVELMIKGDEVYFADVTASPHTSVWVTVRSQRLSAFELHARTVLGLPVDTMMMSPAAAHAIGPRGDGGSPGAGALAGALRVPESDVRLFGVASAGVGVALATAPEVATARDRARQVANTLNVRDSRG